jgi:anti-sigma B factor antagonist
MEIIEIIDREIGIFKLEGRLDSISSETLDARIDQMLQNGAKHLVIDCEHLDYITSAGLRVLNKTAKRLTRSQGKIILYAMADYVREIFEIAGFDTFLPIVATFEDAKGKI